MCGGGGKKSAGPVAQPAPKPQVSPTVQAMLNALTHGPTGYTGDVKQNLGMDVRNHGYQGGRRPQSGMTQTGQGPFGYRPVAAKADPLEPLLSQQPKGPATKAGVNDLLLGK